MITMELIEYSDDFVLRFRRRIKPQWRLPR
jgi:hypothetical protein